MKPSIRAQNILELMREIIDLLEHENELLDTPRSAELSPIVKQKQNLFAQYETQLSELNGGSGLRAELTPELRKEIEALSKRFQKVTRENELKLAAMVKSSEQIVETISREARKKSQPVATYNQMGAGYSQNNQRAAAVAINQQL